MRGLAFLACMDVDNIFWNCPDKQSRTCMATGSATKRLVHTRSSLGTLGYTSMLGSSRIFYASLDCHGTSAEWELGMGGCKLQHYSSEKSSSGKVFEVKTFLVLFKK
jgi:hypothetical protein